MAENVYEKKVTIRELVDFFKFERLTGDEKSLDRWSYQTLIVRDLSCVDSIKWQNHAEL